VSQGADGVFVIKPRPAAVATQRTPAPQNAAPESPAPAAIADEPLTARASEGPWLLGVSVDYEPDNGHANGGATAAIAAEYFFTDYFAAAVALTVPRTYSLAGGHGRLQSYAMTLKYYFAPEGRWDPYLGAGADVTALYDASGSTARDRVISGPVAEAGVNLRLDRHWMLNADLSWAQDPLRFGLGFVYRF
jgi:outer membrane protein W